MVAFAPSSTSHGSKFDDCVEWHFDGHAPFNRCITKVGNQCLKDAHVTDHKRWDDLLLDINDHWSQPIDQVAIALPSQKTIEAKVTLPLVQASRNAH